MSEAEKPKPPTLPAVLWTLAGLIFQREALLVITSGVVMLAAGGAGVVWAQGKLDGGVAPVREELRRHEAEERAAREALAAEARLVREAQERTNERLLEAMQSMEDRSARRFDALQNTILERRAQPESAALARPAAVVGRDGGP